MQHLQTPDTLKCFNPLTRGLNCQFLYFFGMKKGNGNIHKNVSQSIKYKEL